MEGKPSTLASISIASTTPGVAIIGPLVVGGNVSSTGSVTATTFTATGSAFSVGTSGLVLTGGKVGVNTSTPNTTLEVDGTFSWGTQPGLSTATAGGNINFQSGTGVGANCDAGPDACIWVYKSPISATRFMNGGIEQSLITPSQFLIEELLNVTGAGITATYGVKSATAAVSGLLTVGGSVQTSSISSTANGVTFSTSATFAGGVSIQQNGATLGLFPNSGFVAVASTNSFFQSVFQNLSTGAAASTDLILVSDQGTNTSQYLDIGVNGSNYNQAGFTVTGGSGPYILSSDRRITFGSNFNAAAGGVSGFSFVNGVQISTDTAFSIDATSSTFYGSSGVVFKSSATFSGMTVNNALCIMATTKQLGHCATAPLPSCTCTPN